MTIRNISLLLAGAACLGLTGAASAASAQAAAPAAAAMPSGPALPGICVFSNERAIGTSVVGKYVGTRIQQLTTAANAEVGAEKNGIETDGRALEAQKATISADVYQQRALALNQRIQSLQRKAELRGREMDATEQKAVSRIATEVNPLLRTVYTQHNCGLLLDRNAVFGSNPSMDVTDDVVKLLDAKITQFPFDREHLDQPQAAGAAAATPRN